MTPAQKNKIERLKDYCSDARWESKEVLVKDYTGSDNYVIAFRVRYREDKVVETTSGDAFIREGDRKVRIPEDLKRELRIAKGEIHYELERVPLQFPEDFDQNLIERFCESYFKNRSMKTRRSREETLELAKLGKRTAHGFMPNLACCLLLSKDPRDVVPGARIRLIRYDGNTEKFGEEQNSIHTEFIDGPIPILLDAARERVAAHIKSFQRLSDNGRLERRSEYPEAAWLEAIVNAVAHRSYNFKNQNIFVKIFDNRLVVESPGGFMPPTTSETVYDAHNPRNPNLMEAMMHFEITFCAYEGTRRMREAMLKADLPAPEFSQIESNGHKIRVTLGNTMASTSEKLINKISASDVIDKLSREELIIIRYILDHKTITVPIAAEIIGRSPPTANKIINHMVGKDLIEFFVREGAVVKRPRTYSLKDKVFN